MPPSTRRMIWTALGYWSAYPEDVDAFVEHAERAEAEGIASVERARSLLRP